MNTFNLSDCYNIKFPFQISLHLSGEQNLHIQNPFLLKDFVCTRCFCVCVCVFFFFFLHGEWCIHWQHWRIFYIILSWITATEIAVSSILRWIQHCWFRNLTSDCGVRLLFHERYLAALLTVALLKTVTLLPRAALPFTAVVRPTIGLQPAARHKTAAASR